MASHVSFADPSRRGNTAQLVSDRFRLADDLTEFSVSTELPHGPGYFKLGPDAICYGHCSFGRPGKTATEPLSDAREKVVINRTSVKLPFDPAQVVNSLRFERYHQASKTINSMFRRMYYLLRPVLNPSLRRHVQELYFRNWNRAGFPNWPVDVTVENIFEELIRLAMKSRGLETIPFIWFWPDGARSCTAITHDVETATGLDFCTRLMDLDDSCGVKSAFQIVPEQRYRTPRLLLESMKRRGFEVNIHDLNHDGLLFSNKKQFLRRAERINSYARQFGARGFRSAILYRNIDWFDALNFSYDMSIPNVGHLEAQRGGCCTVLPYFIGNLLELPVTTTQDYSLFHILKEYSSRLWKEQISLIRKKHGLITFIIHPDYVRAHKAREVYMELLRHLADLRSRAETWIALPGEIADWWRLRSKMNLVKAENSWRIEGVGSKRARVAYAVLKNDRVVYNFYPGA